MADCIFCNINKQEIVASTKLLIAFYDRSPVTLHHVLIVPKQHRLDFLTSMIKNGENWGLFCKR